MTDRCRARGVAVLVAWLSLATIACSTPIGVSRVDPAMTVISTGTKLWDGVAKEPLDDLRLSAESREDLRAMMFFEPLPFVERVVVMSTPQLSGPQRRRRPLPSCRHAPGRRRAHQQGCGQR
jgi:hypothetical protein